MKRLIVDLDDTISFTENGLYDAAKPNIELIQRLREYHDIGFEIVIFSSRNMRTYSNNVGKVNIFTLPKILEWLDRYSIPYDEVYVGKPWCGFEGFYVDDRAIRPSEFIKYSYNEIMSILSSEKN
jgi:capsule biosynthesis phosphatase